MEHLKVETRWENDRHSCWVFYIYTYVVTRLPQGNDNVKLFARMVPDISAGFLDWGLKKNAWAGKLTSRTPIFVPETSA